MLLISYTPSIDINEDKEELLIATKKSVSIIYLYYGVVAIADFYGMSLSDNI